MFECNHVIDIRERRSYCPSCGRFLKNIFIGQPLDVKPTPTELLLEKIYKEHNATGVVLKLPHGAETQNNILPLIKKADICLFDTTNEILNVAYEFGFALGYSANKGLQSDRIEANRKYILVGNDFCTSYKNYFLRPCFDLKPLIPIEKKCQKITKQYIEKTRKDLPFLKRYVFHFVKLLYQSDDTTKIERDINNCEKELEKSLFDVDIGIETLSTYDGIGFPIATTESDGLKRILILTNNNHIKYFENISSEQKLKGKIKIDVDVPDKAFISLILNQILKNTLSNYVGKYDIIISHLLGGEIDYIDESDAKKHNFKVGIISGIMDGFRYEKYPSCYFLAHENIKESFVRGSDLLANTQRYVSLEKIKEKVIYLVNNIT